MIRAYPNQSSIFAGQTLTLHVSTDRPKFRVSFYRQGQSLKLMQSSGWMVGQNFPLGLADKDWGWPGYVFSIPADWPSGAYIAMFHEGDSNGVEVSAPDATTADARDSKALFVVKNPQPGKSTCILYKVPLFTYQAYNEVVPRDGSSLYTGAGKVTLRRPGGGTGGTPWDFAPYPDVYDTTSPRQTFAHWDAPFISWLEANGYTVDYCTDLDVHQNAHNILASYHVLLSVGHDEYWSAPLRQHVESFIRGGGNVAFFSGNTCWWRVHVEDNDTAITCDKSKHQGDAVEFDQWYRVDPENKVTGVSYRNGGGDWLGERDPAGYTVELANHWVYKGTKLQNGEVFGADERVVGYEADGALFHVGSSGFKEPDATDGTPADFVILGTYALPSWSAQDLSNRQATMGLYTNVGKVFTAATVDWARVLDSGREETVDLITRNVLNCFKSRCVEIIGPLPGHCNRYVAVTGSTVHFHVNTAGLPNQGKLSYLWNIAGGTIPMGGVSNQPIFQAVMPATPEPVTVSVVVDDGTICKAFGTLTFTPLSLEEFLQSETFCEMGTIASVTAGFKKALVGVGEGNRFFVDPLWDPIRNATRSPLNLYELHVLLESGRNLVSFAERLIELNQRERG
jgi:hypothetical protein